MTVIKVKNDRNEWVPIPASSSSLPSGGTVGQVLKKTDTGTEWDDANNHEHSADNITRGTLPIERGGTGATTASDARTTLGAAASSHTHSASNITSGTLSITYGGTGASSASAALTNLGAAPIYQYSTTDLTAGSSSLTTGKLYFVYE